MTPFTLHQLTEISSLEERLDQVPWKEADVNCLLSHLRPLRACFTDSSSGADISQEQCARVLSTISSLLSSLLTPQTRLYLDQTDGRDHLSLSVAIQCLVNCLSYMGPRKMHVSGEIVATIVASLVYNADTCSWVFCLTPGRPLPLWRARIGCYAFILITSLITSTQQTGIPPDFARFLHVSAQCMRVVVVAGGENAQLERDWFDHCLSLTGALCTSPPTLAYWTHEVLGQERILELSAFLGTLLLLQDYGEKLDDLESPSLKKLAETCLQSCLSVMTVPRQAWLNTLLAALRHCITRSPFQLRHEEDGCKPTVEPISVLLSDNNIPQLLGIMRGAIYIMVALLPPIEEASSDNASSLIDNDRLLADLIACVGDVLVIVDSLLQAHLAACEPIGPRKKPPSLMDSMVRSLRLPRSSHQFSNRILSHTAYARFAPATYLGVFRFDAPQSICFASDLKQELIRCLLAIVHARPNLVPCIADHARATSIKCVSVVDAIPVNARDVFWAVINSTQRDPASPVAVEWTIVLLRLLLKPADASAEVQRAAASMSERIAQLKPTATIREQLKTLVGVELPK
ncbi:unnamed protein product [Mesocestoides corti]|nr:unnamed protein product [Mesocestoides corti]